MTFILFRFCSMAGGVMILSAVLHGAYHAASGIGKPRPRRSFLILRMIQVSRGDVWSLGKWIADELIIGLEDNFHRYRNHHYCVFGQSVTGKSRPSTCKPGRWMGRSWWIEFTVSILVGYWSILPSFHSFTRAGGIPYHQNLWCISLGLVLVLLNYPSVTKACFMWRIRLR